MAGGASLAGGASPVGVAEEHGAVRYVVNTSRLAPSPTARHVEVIANLTGPFSCMSCRVLQPQGTSSSWNKPPQKRGPEAPPAGSAGPAGSTSAAAPAPGQQVHFNAGEVTKFFNRGL